MIMIPLPFVMALAAVLLLAREWMMPSQRHYWLMMFLGLLAFQEFLIGARFGYGVDSLKYIQPISAAALPPLAYLSFARPKAGILVLIHAIPVVAILIILFLFINAMDGFLAANNLFYSVALILMGLRGSDALPWAEFGRTRIAIIMLWLVVAILLVSGLTDALISYDFLKTQGSNIGRIVGWASATGILVLGGVFVWVRTGAAKQQNSPKDLAHEQAVFARLETLMEQERLFIDPDINLSRIARRMSLPVRDVSRAINTQTQQNVSQYVNALRIKEACRLLADSKMKVTEIIFASGYNTKSNFNREFARVTGKTPSEWRKANEKIKGAHSDAL